ncbi:Uncharacterised protein [uncultured archaeon]|nr:Uncharacterised protein [uncultured archaeon]
MINMNKRHMWKTALTLLILLPHAYADEPTCNLHVTIPGQQTDFILQKCENIGTFSLGGLYNGSWEPLTYRYPDSWPGTFITLYVDGTAFTTSKQPRDGIPLDEYAAQKPEKTNNSATTLWLVPGEITLTQTLTLKNTTVYITLTANNTDNKPHTTAFRIHYDTMLGANDGAPIYVPTEGLLTTEKEIQITSTPVEYWKAYNRPESPTIVAGGFLDKKRGATTPQSIVVADWKKSKNTAWDYAVTPGHPITGDSALILYYSKKTLQPGKDNTITAAYGSQDPLVAEKPAEGKPSLLVTYLAVDNANNTYCSGANATVYVDVLNAGAPTDANVTLTINSPNRTYYNNTMPVTIQTDQVRTLRYTFTIPENATYDIVSATVRVSVAEARVNKTYQGAFIVGGTVCPQPVEIPVTSLALILLFTLILLFVLLVLAVILGFIPGGEVSVEKTKKGNRVHIRILNGTRKPITNCVLTDPLPHGAEVNVPTLNVRRTESQLEIEIGTLHPGQTAILEYTIKGADVIPKARLKFDQGEIESKNQ